MFIDVHTHAFHPKIADKVLSQLNGHYGIVPQGTGLAEDLIERLKKAGIDRAAVHTAATSPDQVIPANNWAIHLKENYPELVPFGSIHPEYPDWEKELERLEKKGITGIKLHPDFQGFFLNDPGLGPIFEAIGERFTLMVHVGDRLPPDKNPSCPIKLSAVMRDFPKLKIIAAHLGGYLHWKWAVQHLVGKNLYFDTSSSIPFIPGPLLQEIFNKHPKERILFGSDYPLFDPGPELSALKKRMRFSDDDLEILLSNADALF